MADVIVTDKNLRIDDIGCGVMRRALLALEPGSRIWLEVEGLPVLFERMSDESGDAARTLLPIGKTALNWHNATARAGCVMAELDFAERATDGTRPEDRLS